MPELKNRLKLERYFIWNWCETFSVKGLTVVNILDFAGFMVSDPTIQF